MALEIQVMASDRHKKVVGLNGLWDSPSNVLMFWFMGPSIQCTHVLVYGTLHPMYSCFGLWDSPSNVLMFSPSFLFEWEGGKI